MSDNKKYYYLKLKANFFDSNEMIALELMPDGYKYSNILLKMYLRSLERNGKLMFSDRIPFDYTTLAAVTRHSVGDVERAIEIFEHLGLVEKLDSGAIYMADIQNFIGRSSTEADRKRQYRASIETEKRKKLPTGHLSDKRPPEKELEIETEIEKEKSPNSGKPKFGPADIPYQISVYLFKKIRINNPGAKKPNIQQWADDARLMLDKDKRDPTQVKEIIDWCQADDFWFKNILSVKTLRKKFDQLVVSAQKRSNSSSQPVERMDIPDEPPLTPEEQKENMDSINQLQDKLNKRKEDLKNEKEK